MFSQRPSVGLIWQKMLQITRLLGQKHSEFRTKTFRFQEEDPVEGGILIKRGR